MIRRSTEITQYKLEEIERMIREFKEKLEAGVSDYAKFITMNEIEQLWSELRNGTNHVYSDMLGELISAVDESELIYQKKESMRNGK